MNVKSYYVDTCIYLNLWQKEVDEITGEEHWKIAKDFFDKIDSENAIIYYSGYILKELKFILSEWEFNQKIRMFKSSPNFLRIILSSEEYNLARRIEFETDYKISFYDIMHMLLSKKTNSILITKDKKLIEICAKYDVIAKIPEKIL